MTEHPTVPTRAYDLLEPFERQAADSYVEFAISEQRRKRQRIIYALTIPIPSEYVRRSKGILAKPLVKAAIAEKLHEAAEEEDASPARVIREHVAIAFSNMADYIEIQSFGDFTVKPLDQIPRDKMAAVKALRTIPGPYGLRTEVILHDKQQSLKVLTELLGLIAPDKPPVLGEYAKPPAQQAVIDQVPEAAYVQLLEQGQCRT